MLWQNELEFFSGKFDILCVTALVIGSITSAVRCFNLIGSCPARKN
jgi:hypothetical protein